MALQIPAVGQMKYIVFDTDHIILISMRAFAHKV